MNEKKGNESEEDLKNKFQRLAQEYTKIKNQNSILKKAVLQEQQKNKELEIQLKEKEVAIRTTLEENELLNFNNQRLTKRITILQNEIGENNSKPSDSPGWFSSGKKTDVRRKQDLEVATQELQIKIEENERLHIKIFEQSQSYKAILDDLESQITQMKKTLQANDDQFTVMKIQHEKEQEKMDCDIKNSINKISTLEYALQRTNEMMEQKDDEYARIKLFLEEGLEKAQNLIDKKLFFDDTKSSILNTYNVPTCPRLFKKIGSNLMKEGVSNLENIIKALKDFYQFFLKRVGYNYKILETLSSEENVPQLLHAHQQLQKISNQAPDYLQKLIDSIGMACKQYVETQQISKQTNSALSQSFSQFIGMNAQISSYYDLITQLDNTPDDVKERHKIAVERFSLVYNALERIASYFHSFFPRENDYSLSTYCELNFSFLLGKILHSLKHLQHTFNDFFSTLRSEMDIEAQNIFYRPENKLNNQNLLSTQDPIISNASLLISTFENYIDQTHSLSTTNSSSSFHFSDNYLVRGAVRSIDYPNTITQRSRQFLQFVNQQPDWISVPYEQAVYNLVFIKEVEQKKQIYESTISSLKAKLMDEDKEKQKCYAEISQMKDTLASKQSQINSILTELAASRQVADNLKTMLEQRVQSSPQLPSSVTADSISEEFKKIDLLIENSKAGFTSNKEVERRYSMTVVDENGEQDNSLNVSHVDKERESAIKEHYKTKRAQLLSQLKETDIKALKYFSELEKALKELNLCKLDSADCKKQLSDSVEKLQIARDDLDSTRKNYEDQMKMLTEHFGKLNDQIAEKEDLVTKLKSHKVHCGRCGIWNTVAWLITEGNNGRKCSRGNHPSSYNFN